VTPHEQEYGGGAHDRRDHESHRHPPAEPHDLLAERVRRQAVRAGPEDCAGGIAHEETLPGHPVHAGEKSGECAQQRDEAAQQHHFPAVPPEQQLAKLDARFVDPQQVAVAQQQRVPEPAADQITGVVTDYRADRRPQDHERNAQVMRRPGIDSRRHQHCFPRQRNAHALEANDDRDDRVPVAGDKAGERHAK
jgi:hypothetical protein